MNVFVSVAGAREPMSPTYLQGLAHLSLGEFGVALGGARVAVAEDALDDLQPLALLNQLGRARVAKLVERVVRLAMLISEANAGTRLGPLVVHGVVAQAGATV